MTERKGTVERMTKEKTARTGGGISAEAEGRYGRRDCLKCGRSFSPRSHHDAFCSENCRRAYSYAARGISVDPRDVYCEKRVGDRSKCEWCGRTFTLRSANARYCSPVCAKSAENGRAAIRRAESAPVRAKRDAESKRRADELEEVRRVMALPHAKRWTYARNWTQAQRNYAKAIEARRWSGGADT